MRPPVFVVPAGALTVFFPRIVLEHSKGDLLLLASDHLVTNVVRDDGDFNFNITVTATKLRKTGDFLGFPRGCSASSWGG